MTKTAVSLRTAWWCSAVVLSPAALPAAAIAAPIRLEATTASEWVQSPKVSPSGKAIAYLVTGPDGRQRIEVRGNGTPKAPMASRQLDPAAVRAYWLNWIGDHQLDVRVSERGGKEQILRWTVPTDTISRVLPDATELSLTFSSSFSNFASPVERFSLGERTFAYDDRVGSLVDTARGLVPDPCSAGGARVLRVYGDPQQMTWELTSKESTEAPWRLVVRPEDRRQGTAIVSVSTSKCVADFVDSVGRDTLAVRRLDLRSGSYSTVFESTRDPEYVSVDRRSGVVDIVGVEDSVPHGVGMSAESREILEKVAAKFPGGYYIADRSNQNRFWLVRHGDARCNPTWSVIDTSVDRELWATPEPTMKWQAECHRKIVVIERPGEPNIGAVLTSPADRDCKKVTCDLVLMLHGGPAVRDRFLTDPFAAELAAAGYIVLNVNFRGSSGFGKAFASRDSGNWGSGIPGDVYAAVDHLSAEGYRLGKKISFGASFGGYLSLLAATRDQKVDCAIAQSSPPDLVGFIRAMDTLTYGRTDLFARVGNPDIPAQADQIRSISPLSFASRGKAAVLLVNGGKDLQSPLDDVKAFAKLRSKTAPLSMFVFLDEGHDVSGLANRTLFLSVVSVFIERCSNPAATGATMLLPSEEAVQYFDGMGLLRNK